MGGIKIIGKVSSRLTVVIIMGNLTEHGQI